MRRMTAVCSGFLLLGCSASAPDRTEDKISRMEEFRRDVGMLKGQVGAVLASLNEISSKAASGPRPAYDAYVDRVSETGSKTEGLLGSAAALKARGEAYFEEWGKELATITNVEIRQRAEDRRQKMKATYGKIDVSVAAAREALAPFNSDLKDIQTLLGNELTPAGISGAKDLVTKVTTQGEKVKERLDSLDKEVERAASELRISAPRASP